MERSKRCRLASIGIALLVAACADGTLPPMAPNDPAILLRRADAALYEAKRRGRDRYAMSPLHFAAS